MEKIEVVLSRLYYRLAELSADGYIDIVYIENEIEMYRDKTKISKLDFILTIRNCLEQSAKSMRSRVIIRPDGKVYFCELRGGAIIENLQDYKDEGALERQTRELIDIWLSATFIETDIRNGGLFPITKRIRLKLGDLLKLLEVVTEIQNKYETENTISANSSLSIQQSTLTTTPQIFSKSLIKGIDGTSLSNPQQLTTRPQSPKSNTPNIEAQKGFPIDKTALEACFNAKFKGAGGNMNYMANLIEDLQKERCGKDFARIALLIQDSDYLITTWKKEEFSKWHSHFCKVVGCKYVKYDPCKLRGEEYQKIKTVFYYL